MPDCCDVRQLRLTATVIVARICICIAILVVANSICIRRVTGNIRANAR